MDDALIEDMAKAILGPHLPLPEGSKWTLAELRQINWDHPANRNERGLALSAAKAILRDFDVQPKK